MPVNGIKSGAAGEQIFLAGLSESMHTELQHMQIHLARPLNESIEQQASESGRAKRIYACYHNR